MPTLDDYIIPGREKEQVPLARIMPDPENVRRHYTKKEIVSLALSLATRGQEQPAIIERFKRYDCVVAGNRRYWASIYARDHGWMKRDWMLGTVTRKLPPTLRLKIQRHENEHKEKVPAERLADSVWGMYKVMLAEFLGGENADTVHESETYWDIPQELRKQLPLTQYAASIELDLSTVRRAFRYQKLNQVIRKEVVKGDVSYSAAEPLASVENKNHQITILGAARQSKEKETGKTQPVAATERRVRTAIQEYLELQYKAGKGFMQPQKTKEVRRTSRGRDLSLCLGEAARIVRILETLAEFDPSVLDLVAGYNGGQTTPREILSKAYASVSQFHGQFLSDPAYNRRWEYAPRIKTIEEFVAGGKVAEGEDKTLMQSAKHEVVDIDKIEPNPLNPRGVEQDFDQEGLEELADSLKDVGLIQAVLVMRDNRRYINLEGHRRIAAAKIAGIKKARALVLPRLTREEQLAIMYDADIFERIDLHDRAEGIARQFKLELEQNPNLTVDEFCKGHETKSRRIVRDALAYNILHQRVKRMYQEGLLTYPLVVREIAQETDAESQIHLAEAVAMFRLSAQDLNQQRERIGKNQGTLWDKKVLKKMRMEGQRKWMITHLKDCLESIPLHFSYFSPKDLRKFYKDYYLTHKFQRFFSILDEATQSIAA